MNLSKRQLRLAIVLNMVIVILLCGLFFRYPLGESYVDAPIDETHDIYRNSRLSLNINLDYETNIGGSLDDELIAAFPSPDQKSIHIFGNTDSNDYDFDNKSGNIFYLIANRKGKIERINTLGESNEVLRKVIMAEGGYLLAIDNTSAKSTHLLHLNYDGEIIRTLRHAMVSDEKVADLILLENSYALVVHSGITSMNFYDIKVFFYALDCKEIGTAVLHNPSYSQEYVAMLPRGVDKYIMAVNFKSDLWNGMSLIEFTIASSQHKKIVLENNYQAYGYMPITGGYLALIIDSDNRASAITLSSTDFSLREKKYLATDATDAKLFFANSEYFTYINCTESTLVFRFNIDLSSNDNLAVFSGSGKVTQSYARGEGVIFTCSGEKASVIGITANQNWLIRLGNEGEITNTMLVFLENDTLLVCESNIKGGDIGNNFGKKDIWIAKVVL